MVRLPPIIVFAAAALVAPSAASGQGSIEVVGAGWGGVIVSNTWAPVRVRTAPVEDPRAQVEVVVYVRYPRAAQGTFEEYPVAAYRQPIQPGGSRDLVVWVLTPGAGSARVRLISGSQILAETRAELLTGGSANPLFVGVLADSPAVAEIVSKPEAYHPVLGVALHAVDLRPADLPSDAERLTALNALVVQGSAAAGLNDPQRRAIHDWVADGGRLILLGDGPTFAPAAALPPGSLPLTYLGEAAAADLGPLLRWAATPPVVTAAGPAARLRAEGGRILVGTPQQPLVWQTESGLGTILVLAADPTSGALASPLSSYVLWTALNPGPERDSSTPRVPIQPRQNATRLQGMIDTLPADAFPGWPIVALILGAFALLVGPVAYVSLHRIDRRGWTWITVPAAAAALAVALYVAGAGTGGRDVLVHVLSHVQIDPDRGEARQALVAGFYAPTHPAFQVNVPGDVPVRAGPASPGYYGTSYYGSSGYLYGGAYSEGFGGSYPVPYVRTAPYGGYGWSSGFIGALSGEPPVRFTLGETTQVEFAAGQWNMRPVALDRRLGPEVGRISANLNVDDGLIRGTVRNDTPYPLEDAAVVTRRSLARLGTLAPGQSAPVVIDPRPEASATSRYVQLSWRLFQRSANGETPGAGGEETRPSLPPGVADHRQMPSGREAQRRIRLMDIATQSRGPGLPGSTQALRFLGFSRSPVGAGAPSAGDHPTHALTLLEQPLRLHLGPGPFSIPAGIVPGDRSAAAPMPEIGRAAQLMTGSAVFRFRLPIPGSARVERLSVTTQQWSEAESQWRPGPAMLTDPSTPPGPAEAGTFRIYNWQTARWDALPGGVVETHLDPAAPYVRSDLTIEVEVRTEAGRRVVFMPPEIAVEGTVPG